MSLGQRFWERAPWLIGEALVAVVGVLLFVGTIQLTGPNLFVKSAMAVLAFAITFTAVLAVIDIWTD